MASRFADHPEAVRETLALAERLTFDLTKDLGYRYPGAEDEDASRAPGRAVRGAPGRALRPDARPHPRRAGAERGGAGAAGAGAARDRAGSGWRASSCSTTRCSSWRARSPLEVRGPDSVRALLAPGRGRGSSVSSLVCYLTGLSHIDPVAGKLALGRFLHEDLHGLPDIDLDFPRDIRERLIPRVHERYGRERAALVAAFPDVPRARGDPRAGQGARPARRRDRACGPRRRARPAPSPSTGIGEPLAGATPAPSIASGSASPSSAGAGWSAGRAGLRPAPAPLPALGRDDHRDQAADRLLPGRAGRDGGQADGPVGQGLVRGRRLPEDRPAGPGDALGGRALRGGDRARARASASTSRASPSTIRRPSGRSARPTRSASFRSRAARRCSRCCARARENLEDLTIQVAIVRPGPIQGGAVNPYIERRQRLREDPSYEIPYEHPALEPVLRRRSARSSSRTR